MILSCILDVNLRLTDTPWPPLAIKLPVSVALKRKRESMPAYSIYTVLLIMHVQRHYPLPQIKHGGNSVRCFEDLDITRVELVRALQCRSQGTYHPLWAHRYSNTDSLHFDLEHMSPQYPDWL